MTSDRLVAMANQIGRFFVTQDEASAVAGIADHLDKFWAPPMRAAIVAHLAAGGEGLDPQVRAAVAALGTPAPASDNGRPGIPDER